MIKINYAEYAKKLTDLLGLEFPPLGAKFLRTNEPVPEGFNPPSKKIRFCQAVMEASWGKSLVIKPEEIACGPGPATFGAPIKEKVIRGEVHHALGLYETPEVAAKAILSNYRFPFGAVANILVAPIEKFPIQFDSALLRLKPEQAMWIFAAKSYHQVAHTTVIIAPDQSICSYAAVASFLKNDLTLGLGCYGSRTGTDLKLEEMVVGIPESMIATIIEALEKLKKPMEDVRSKKVFYASYPEKTPNT